MIIKKTHIVRIESNDGSIIDTPDYLEAGLPPDGAYFIDDNKNKYFIHESRRDPRVISYHELGFPNNITTFRKTQTEND